MKYEKVVRRYGVQTEELQHAFDRIPRRQKKGEKIAEEKFGEVNVENFPENLSLEVTVMLHPQPWHSLV